MNLAVFCCCNKLPSPCPEAPFVRLRISGVDASKCACSVNHIGFFAVEVLALAMDGDYDVPIFGPGDYLYDQSPGGVTTIRYYTDATCAAEPGIDCTSPRLIIVYQFDCETLNDKGQPLITEIKIRSPFNCIPVSTPQHGFWYQRSTCGGTYYHGDVVPNGGPLGSSCDASDPVCLPSDGTGMLASMGTVQAIP